MSGVGASRSAAWSASEAVELVASAFRAYLGRSETDGVVGSKVEQECGGVHLVRGRDRHLFHERRVAFATESRGRKRVWREEDGRLGGEGHHW